mmetsp:Transcript_58519/g.189604  ORF Transcript_58519/g.189604 Transcript_58519/m.189604 type:complete len:83 (+) Transcript_58519:607-855(+)
MFSVCHEPLLESIAAASVPMISQFTPQNLANTAWAFDILEVCDAPLMHAISAQALRSISEFGAQPLANLAGCSTPLPGHAEF